MNPKDTLWLAEFMEQMDMKLAPAEQEFADALLRIVNKYGKLADRDANGIWVGYQSAEENDNKEIGVKCSNCYFYQSEKVCSIIVQEIEPEGLCRLAAIPPGLVKMQGDDEDGEEEG